LAYAPGFLSLANSTVSSNRAAGGNGTAAGNGFGGNGAAGGGYTQGECSITSSTITLNRAAGGKGRFRRRTGVARGISSSGPDLIVGSTILAGNLAPTAPDLSRPANLAAVTTLGNNLVGLGTGVSGLTNGVNGDQVGSPTSIDARLGPLA